MVHVLDMEDKEDKLTKNDSSSELDELPVKKTIVVKEKKARSEAQINAFKQTQINRAKSIQLKKDSQKLEAAKLILKQEPEKKEKKMKPVVVDSSDSSSEEEVIIVEKRKKKNKPKRIIVEESSSEEEQEAPREKVFKSQQNRRSINLNVKPVPAPTTVFFV
jgi:hypothetical protein